MSARILVLPGTAEPGGGEHRLAFEAARRLSVTAASLTVLNICDYPLPLLDVGDEATVAPPAARRLAEHIAAADGLLLVSPEANDSVPALLKNAVDWAARVPGPGGRLLRPFAGLVVALASASPGGSRTFPALAAWRPVFAALGAETIAAECRIAGSEAFDAGGRLVDDAAGAAMEAFLGEFLTRAEALARHAP